MPTEAGVIVLLGLPDQLVGGHDVFLRGTQIAVFIADVHHRLFGLGDTGQGEGAEQGEGGETGHARPGRD